MKIKVDDKIILMLNQVKGKMLMREDGNRLVIVKEFTINEIKGRKYITEITILSYSKEGKFLGMCTEDTCSYYINRINFYALRQNWVDFQEQLREFGFEIKPIKNEIQESSSIDETDYKPGWNI
jgi:hypothetical protein